MFYERMLVNNNAPVNKISKDQSTFFQESHHVAVHALFHLVPISPASHFNSIVATLPLTSLKTQGN